jgi:heptosyltransferase-3
MDNQSIKKILVIKLRHHGDVLLTSPFFSALKHFFPEAEIDVVLYEETLPVLKYHPAISQFHLVDRKWKKLSILGRFKKELELIKTLKVRSYDLAFNLTEGDRGALYAFLAGAKKRVGLNVKSGFLWKSKLYTTLVKESPTMKHTVEMNLDFLRSMGFYPPFHTRELVLNCHENDFLKVSELTKSLDEYIVVHPVSRWMFKALPIETMKEVVKACLDRGKNIVLTGSSSEDEMAYNRALKEGLGGAHLLDLSGKLSILELAALMHRSKGVVTVDSLPMHMAAALKTPVVAAFGPTSEIRWAPWRHPQARVVTQNLPCRPCYRPGCQDSHRSDCLETLPAQKMLEAILEVII